MVDSDSQHEKAMDHQVTDADAHQCDHAITSDQEKDDDQECRPGTDGEEEQSGSGSSQDEGDGEEGAAPRGSGLRKPNVRIKHEAPEWP